MIRTVIAIIVALVFTAPALAAEGDVSPSTQGSSSSQLSGSAGLDVLQPANTTQLQSADAAGGGISQSPSQPNLQPVGGSDQAIPLLQGETEGQQKLDSNDESNPPNWAWLLLIPFAVVGILWFRSRA